MTKLARVRDLVLEIVFTLLLIDQIKFSFRYVQ